MTSVHELARIRLSHLDQLGFANEEDMMVNRNRDYFIQLNAEFYKAGELHTGLLVVVASHTVPSSFSEYLLKVLHSLPRLNFDR